MTHQMARHIHEVEVFGADELDGRSLEQAKVILADVSGVLDGFPSDLVDVGLGADDADWEKRGTSARRSGRGEAPRAIRAHHSPEE